jgi:ABC-type proline/glycine betaine transport system ATPase subunit
MGAPRDDGFDYDFDIPTPTKSSNIEASSRNMRAGVNIKKLTKKFGSKTAVNQLSLEMYDGQITTLLGKF